MTNGKRLFALAAFAALGASGVALAVGGLLGVEDVSYASPFLLTSVQASFLVGGKIGFALAGYARGDPALTLKASCVWDPGTGKALEVVDFGTGKINSTSFCPADPWVQDVPCTLIAANGSDPEMDKLRARMKFGWPMSARVLFGERSKVQDALANAPHPTPTRPPVPTRPGKNAVSNVPTSTPTPMQIHWVSPNLFLPDYGATYGLPLVMGSFRAGSVLAWDVTVKNGSNKTWPANGNFKLSYYWYQNRMPVSVKERHTPIPKDVKPLDSVVVHASFVVPPKPGTYLLRWDMIEEGGMWFSAKGVPTGDRTIAVGP
jgi:hypothetical protein